jgi:hypothetical protein
VNEGRNVVLIRGLGSFIEKNRVKVGEDKVSESKK